VFIAVSVRRDCDIFATEELYLQELEYGARTKHLPKANLNEPLANS
jgi:hypothetical protein